MTPKVKVFFVFLALLAIFSVFSFFDVFRGVRSAKLYESPDSLPLGIESDADQDGLSNQDESYWNTDFQNPDSDGDGFLDGEEVASGFDPREASSHELGDRLQDTVFGSVRMVEAGDFEKVNLTDDASNLLVAGIAAGDLTRTSDDKAYETGINAVAFSTIDNFYKSLPTIDPTLSIISDSEENQNKYLESLAQIIQDNLLNFPYTLNYNKNPFEQSAFFLARGESLRLSLENTSRLEVPKNWAETHIKVLDLLGRFSLNYNAIGHYDDDSIKAIIAFNDIDNLNSLTQDLLEEIQGIIQANNLDPGNLVFKIMNTLLGTQ